MKKYTLILILVFVGAIVFSTGCGKKDDFDLDEVNELWENQVLLLDAYINSMEKVKDAGEAVTAMDVFAAGLEKNSDGFNGFFKKYPAFIERIEKEAEEKPEANEENLKKKDALEKLITVALFTESIIKMNVGRFKTNAEVESAMKRLKESQAKIKPDDSFRDKEEIIRQYTQLVHGKVTGSTNPAVIKFLAKMRRAAITSRIKITMRNIYLLGRAIESFKVNNQDVPRIKDVEQLKTYQDFIPNYFKDEQSLPQEDGWGNYLYYKAEGNDYWLGSGGSDGKFSGFDQEGLYTELEGSDVVYSNGQFVFGPQAAAKPKDAA
ncbi:MAG: hypothetical protein GY950_37410, partial [bacterium]|nr:hypothetical protein [bacterium]